MKNDFRNIHQIFTIRDHLSQKQKFLRKSVKVGRILDNSRLNYLFELSFGILYRSRKSKDKFVNQPHPTKIVKIGAFFMFLRKKS